jgi:multiple sugar transport system permease protein
MRRSGARVVWPRLVGDLLHHLPRIALAGLFVIPLLWVVSASFRAQRQPPPRTIEWIPDPIAWSNYIAIFDLVPIETYLRNSLLVVFVGVPLTVVTASWAGLAMAQMPTAIRRNLLVFAVMLLMVPITALWLTRFLIFRYLGLIDTIWVLMVPAGMGMSPLFILLFYWTFRRVPTQLFDAARLDGASLLQIWAKIAMPLAWPTTVAVSILSFALLWSDFISPLIYLKSEANYTLPVGMTILKQMDSTNWPLLMVGAVIVTAPILVLFFFIQRYFWPESRAG